MQPTILIIDDSEDDARITKMVLLKSGRDIRTEVALSGVTGLARIREGQVKPKLILLDLKMHGMNGTEVLRRIRDDKELSRIPVVIVTNSDLKSDEHACVTMGADRFLHKSANLDQFTKDLECILECCLDTKTFHHDGFI
jgi:CheY-like chemotaxis protein